MPKPDKTNEAKNGPETTQNTPLAAKAGGIGAGITAKNDPTRDRDIEGVWAFINAHHWKASTSECYKAYPHEYTLRENCRNHTEFDWIVTAIRAYGEKHKFKGRTYIYLKLGEYWYWTMGWPAHETTVINRAKQLHE